MTQEKRNFTKVTGGGNGIAWKPQITEKNFMKMGTDNYREGYLTEVREITENVQRPFKVYSLQTVKEDGSFGPVYEVIADAVLGDRLGKLPLGSYVALTYMGRLHKKEITKMEGYTKDVAFTQTNSYHNWEVGVDEQALPYHEVKTALEAKGVSTTPPVEKGTEATTASASTDNPTFNENDDLPF